MLRLLSALVLLGSTLFVACSGDGDDAISAVNNDSTSGTAASVATASPAAPTTRASANFGVPVRLDAGTRWDIVADYPDIYVAEHHGSADGPSGYVAFLLPTQTYNPGSSTLELGAAPADFSQWFADHRLLTVVSSEPVEIAGHSGTQVELTTDSVSNTPLFKVTDGDYELDFRDHVMMIVLDMGDRTMLISYGASPYTNFDGFQSLAQAVLATVQFGE